MVVDIIIAFFFIGALVRGRELGLVRQFFSALGFFGGLFIGALIEPNFIHLAKSQESKLLLTLLITLGLAMICLIIGEYIGIVIKQHLPKKIIDKVDAGIGALAGGVALLIAAWLLAAVLVTLPFGGLQTGIKESYVVNKLDTILPPAPSVVAKLGYLLNPNGFPDVFIGGEPAPLSNVVAPNITGKLRLAVQKDAKSVVKVEGLGCGGLVEGSGFVAGPRLVITNAHVVAGISRPYVIDQNGQHVASVIFFDPNLDFAVLSVNELTGQPLPISTAHVVSATPGAVMGYPEGGNLQSGGAAVMDSFIATGRNIYNQGQTNRQILELRATIVPGNSGGPLINENGDVIGLVFARSTTYQGVGYALATPQVQTELQAASASSSPVSTGQCAE